MEKANTLETSQFSITWDITMSTNAIITSWPSHSTGIAAYAPAEQWKTALNKNSTTYVAINAVTNAVTVSENRMKIVIPEQELKDIVADYLRQQMPERGGENFEVKFTAGRGPEGHYAEIEVSKRAPSTTAPTEEVDQEEAGDEAAIDPFNFGDGDG